MIASGDLSHRGREDQLARASRFLRSLGPPVLAVPGNHDIPYSFPARSTRSFREFERQWETTEPTYASDTLHVVGLNSVRPWRHQSGGIRTGQLEAAQQRLRDAGAFGLSDRRAAPPSDRGAVAVAQEARRPTESCALHARRRRRRLDPRWAHPPGRGQRASRVRDLARQRTRRRRLDCTGTRPAAAAAARRGAGLHVYDIEERCLRIHTFVWQETDWALTAERQFPRGRADPWNRNR